MAAILTAIKVAHTIVWAFFVACIVAIPVASLRDEHRTAAWLAGIVAVEVVVDINNFRPLFSASGHHRCINVDAHNLPICNAVLANSSNRSCNQ